MKCAGCNREFEVGDLYIEDRASGFMGLDGSSEVDRLTDEVMSTILSSPRSDG